MLCEKFGLNPLADAIPIIGKPCQEDMKSSGVLASISAAQFILEGGYGKSELAQNVNNCFGMKESSSATKTAKKAVDTLAREVIQGKWGNGADRKNRLTAAGYNYSAVQKRVNELLK